MISAVITFVILAAACVVSSFFTVEEVASVETKSAGESVVTVIKQIRPKKKTVQKKTVKKENVIASPDAVVQKEEKEEEPEPEVQEQPEEVPETDDSQVDDSQVDDAEDSDDSENYDGEENGNNAESSGEGNEAQEEALSAEAQKAIENYRIYALKRITAKKMYPMKSRAKGHEGNVKLRVEIDTDGTLIKAEVTSPCEFDELNEAALSAVKKSSPFKKMPAESKKLVLNIVMEFKLQ